MVTLTNIVTKRERDCLVILKEEADGDFPVRLHQIAENLSVTSPTALNIIKRLKGKGLVESQDGMVLLTKLGDELTKKILLVHRTFESLFCQSGITKKNACEEAGEIDFLIMPENAELVLKRIDSPISCPHGKPIMEA